MFLKDFYCSRCGSRYPAETAARRCPHCSGLLLADYDFERIKTFLTKDDLRTRTPNIWRYRELLPINDEANIISKGGGPSPLLPLKRVGKNLGVQRLFLKDESLQPCATFKSRGVAMAVSKALEMGFLAVAARAEQMEALAWACYCAAAGLKSVIYAPLGKISERNALAITYTGARLYLHEGREGDEVNAEVLIDINASRYGWRHVAPCYDPYCLEGEKTMAFEIAESFAWELPDVIVSTASSSGALVGIYRGLRDLQRMGWISTKLPRLVAVQPEAHAPLVRAWRERKTEILPPAISGSLAVCHLDERAEVENQIAVILLDGIYKSLGCAVAVNGGEVAQAKATLAADEGILASDDGAAALAAVTSLTREGWIRPGEQVVMLNPEGGMEVFETEEYQPADTEKAPGSLTKFLLSREADILPDVLN
ncbi:MAG: threonine synthase [Deltaproteobacteria bacterium]|nr:threonine synthase [Deltaproteobacteria bacterium]